MDGCARIAEDGVGDACEAGLLAVGDGDLRVLAEAAALLGAARGARPRPGGARRRAVDDDRAARQARALYDRGASEEPRGADRAPAGRAARALHAGRALMAR